MHEMSIAESIVGIALDTLAQQDNAKLKLLAVQVELGALSQVDAHALRFCFDAVVRNLVEYPVRLELKTVAGGGWCMLCAKTVSLSALGAACPECGRYQIQATTGTDMRVLDIEVRE